MKDVGERFIAKAQLLVNGLENVVDAAWRDYNATLDKHTDRVHRGMMTLINRLPVEKTGFIDFKSPIGLRRRNAFFRDVARLYGSWQAGVLGDLDISRWKKGAPGWEKSLGMHPHRGGDFLMRLRDEVVRKAHQVVHVLDHFERHSVGEAAGDKQIKAGVKVKVIGGRGMSKMTDGHSKATSILLRGLKNIIDDQEKAFLENVLRGMDELPRKHANKLYDATTGLTLKEALHAVAHDFSTKQMSKKQLKLSVQTHIRAMIRRVAGESVHMQKIKGIQHFLLTPATRGGKDVITKSVIDRAFKIVTPKELLINTTGSGDSLGLFPGDKIIPVPFPVNFFDDVAAASRAARTEFLAKLDKAGT